MASIVIIGAGVVGQATGKGLIASGHSAVFVDVDLKLLDELRNKHYDVRNLGDLEKEDAEIIIICLPTPLLNGLVDLSYIESVLPHLGRKLAHTKKYNLVVFRSTLPPGTTERLIPRLEESSKKKAGKEFGVCFNPEFLRQISSEQDFLHPWTLVIGALEQKSVETLLNIYECIIKKHETPVTITDLKTAEMIKYVHNLYNATKISFTNEIWTVCQNLHINCDIVMGAVVQSAEAMWNPGYGTKGGYAYGGSCLPKDTECFLEFARQELGLEMPMLESTIKINNSFEKSHGK
jgi:UDPglucose 6-dehydrogenase